MAKKSQSNENQTGKKPTVFQVIVETWIEANKAKTSVEELTSAVKDLKHDQDILIQVIKNLAHDVELMKKKVGNGGSNAN